MQINAAKGARLEFVVAQLEGTCQREVVRFIPKADRGKGGESFIREMVEEPAGFMVYFPRGHALRISTVEELKRYGLNREPRIINMIGLNDPNSPLGKLFRAQDKQGRNAGQKELEKMVMKLATFSSGTTLLPEQLEFEDTE